MDEYKIITFKDGDKEMEILFSKNENTVYLTISQITQLFDISRQTISKHLKQIFSTSLNKGDALPKKLNINQQNFDINLNINSKRRPDLYNLQTILLLGDIFNSNKGLKLKERVDEYIASITEEIIIDDNEIVIYSNDIVHLNINLSKKEETMWLSQSQICKLFMTSQSNVSEHISAILQDKELDENSVYRYFRYTAKDGKSYSVGFYNLDMVLAVGYRVRGRIERYNI